MGRRDGRVSEARGAINVGVVGYGYSGRAFHAYLVGLAEGLRLYAISTRDPARQEAARREHPEARVYATMGELLTDRAVELVVLATPHDTHRDLAIQAMNAGKHVVTDKIMAMDAAQAAEMIEASQRNGVLLSVFHNRRWDWDYLTVRQAIAEGWLGEPYLFQTAIMRYRSPGGWRASLAHSGGILFDWPAHLVDQALQLVGAPVRAVDCQTLSRAHWDSDIESYARLSLRFANDVTYEIEVGNLAAAPKPRWYVLGDGGALVKYGLDPQEGYLKQGRIEAAEEDPADRARITTHVRGQEESWTVESVRGSWTAYYCNIAGALNHGAELAVKPEQVYQAMRVYDAAARSARTGEVVHLE